MSTSLLFAIATVAGVAAGVFFDPGFVAVPSQWMAAAFILITFILAARGLVTLARWGLALCVLPMCVLLGSAAEHRALRSPLRQLLEDRIGGFAMDSRDVGRNDVSVEIEGRLLADAFLTDSGASMRVQVERLSAGACPEPTDGGVSLTVQGVLAAGAVAEWRAGRTIRTTAVLRRPARYLNEGVPDLERMMARRGITLVGTVKSAALVHVTMRGGWLDEAASEVRGAVRRAMLRHVGTRDPQSAAIAVAILIGDRSALDPLVEQRLQEAGTYHVIAISGGNIAILAGLVLGVLWMVSIRGGWAAGFAIVTLAAYAFIAGGGPSVMRATVMAVVYLGLRIIDQKTAALHAMSVTVVALLIASPLSIADVGLWLTFGATAAIVAAAALVRLPESRWWKGPVLLVTASLAAEIVLIPIVAFVFQRVTIAGLVVNLVAIPSMAVVQVAAMLTAAADAAGLDRVAAAAGWFTHGGVLGLVESARLVDIAPWLTWRVPSPDWWLIPIYFLSLTVTLFAPLDRMRQSSRVTTAVVLMMIALAPQRWTRASGDGSLHLTMIDVGQGDALLITLPNGKTMLVDTGGVSLNAEFDIGDRVIGPALRARGIARLDYLAITHAHPDHIGGGASIVRDFRPREIWYGTYVNDDQPTMRLQSLAMRTGAAWRWLQRGERIELGGVEMRVHHPAPEDWQRQRVRNDDSLVIELRYGDVSMLLTGDIGKDVEQSLLPGLDLRPMVVLKSAHHGSATSSAEAFIEYVKPQLVLIGVGRANPYGHPVSASLERYARAGSRVLRTDLHGQIDVWTNGLRLFTTTYGTPRREGTERAF